MNPKQFHNLIEQIYNTQESEIDCSAFQALLPRQVEAEVNQTLSHNSLFQNHRRQCKDCNDLYEALYEIADLETHDEIPSTSELMEDIVGHVEGEEIDERPLPV